MIKIEKKDEKKNIETKNTNNVSNKNIEFKNNNNNKNSNNNHNISKYDIVNKINDDNNNFDNNNYNNINENKNNIDNNLNNKNIQINKNDNNIEIRKEENNYKNMKEKKKIFNNNRLDENYISNNFENEEEEEEEEYEEEEQNENKYNYNNDNKIKNENLNFEKAIKKAGKMADKIIFNNLINIVKKISDIHSEVILMKEKVYLGIVNKFKKEKNNKYLINYFDEEKVVDLPNFEDIKEIYRLKLGDKFNNPKFKFNKYSIKGSFPNEILIWNLISQNTQKIADVLYENYYCCIVLLYYSKVEEENETIMYLINKPSN